MSNTAVSMPVGRRRIRRRLIVLVVLLIPLAVHAVWDQIEARRLAREIAAIAQRGEPVNVTAWRQAPADAELRRAAALYAAAADLARSLSPGFAFENKDPEDHATDTLVSGGKLDAFLREAEPALHVLNAATPLRFDTFGSVAPALHSNQSSLEAINAMNC